jgi:hypothetical protein
MADNITITQGSGTTMATDDVGGAHHPYCKLEFGGDGTATKVSTTDPLPVGGSGAAALGKAEDAAHTTGDVGVGMLGVVTTDGDGTSATDGDYAFATLNALGALRTQDTPNTTGGLTIGRSIDVDETADEIKDSAGMLYGLMLRNDTGATKLYAKLYNDTAANVVVGTTTPVMTIPISAGETIVLEWDKGLVFSAGICIAATTALADADTGAPAANALIANWAFK